jgi:hypothetical protein
MSEWPKSVILQVTLDHVGCNSDKFQIFKQKKILNEIKNNF